MLLSNLILYGTLAACVGLAAIIARQYDLYRLEPKRALLAAVLMGAAGMFASGRVEEMVIERMTGAGHAITDREFAVLAGVTEELFKVLAVCMVALILPRHFDDPLDGLVYGSFAGLGAAVEESVAVLRAAEPSQFLPPQEPIRIAGHLVFGGIGCFGLGLAAMRGRRRWMAVWVIPGALLGAVLLHAAWDDVAFRAALEHRQFERLTARSMAAPAGLMLGGLLAYKVLAWWGASLARVHGQFCDVRTKRCPPAE